MIKEFVIDGYKFQFACSFWQTAKAWGHKVDLHLNGNCISKAKVRYWNRTWERYEYQSCMQNAVTTKIEELQDAAVARWKERNNRKRIFQKEKNELFGSNKTIQTYYKLLKQL